ncbi:MAG: hypothetical protein AB2L14_17790 [Candidatus Xenobiia bacterium LiM19]
MNDDTGLYITGAVIVIALAGFAVYYLIRAWARYMLNSRVAVSPQQAVKGQKIDVTVEITPRLPVTIDMIEITILCQRTYREHQGSGTLFSRRDRDNVEVDNVCKETTYIPFQGEVGAGENKSFSTPVTVPADGVATKRSARSWGEPQQICIEWYVIVRINVKALPDAIHKINIIVRSGI